MAPNQGFSQDFKTEDRLLGKDSVITPKKTKLKILHINCCLSKQRDF